MSYETNNITMLQEVMFELYDVSNGQRTMSKGFAKELADKLADLELRLSTPIIVRGKRNAKT
tara:strand:+ start:122 stop:307 length:186 start_codon:yes stop_codon:yes gene_type:complete